MCIFEDVVIFITVLFRALWRLPVIKFYYLMRYYYQYGNGMEEEGNENNQWEWE